MAEVPAQTVSEGAEIQAIETLTGSTGSTVMVFDSEVIGFNDISGVMTNLALYGKGMRWYLIARARPLPGITLDAKYSETFFSGVKKIGSGNDEISGDILNRLSLSLEAVF